MSYFNQNYFKDANPNIFGNDKLREPQLVAISKAIKYYSKAPKNRSSLIVLPTGTGKTGVISLLPFVLCKKRTLIIAPSTTIRDEILRQITNTNIDNFWHDKEILSHGDYFPNVIEYDRHTTKGVLNKANIVVINIDKAMEHLENSLLKAVDSDFFDLVIIDEAHHAPAKSWKNCIDHFADAKIVNLTGTPFRTDNKEINAELIYKYKLSRAMAHGYVKSLENFVYLPDELKLTIDNDPTEYSVQEIYDLNIRDADWVARSVALSLSCSNSIVDKSFELLKQKKLKSEIPHKIIAVACSIFHAKQIQELYESKGLKSTIIYYELSPKEKETALNDIKNHRVDVVINVNMLGEGYDHPCLSIAAIFRPFKSDLPYAQFIGRVLRKIYKTERPEDNIAQVVSHHHLYLDKLWEKYKKEINESQIISDLNNISEDLSEILDSDDDKIIAFPIPRKIDLGGAVDIGGHSLKKESYLDTELIKQHAKEQEQEKEKIRELMGLLGINDMQARQIINQSKGAQHSDILNRPDLIVKQNKADIDTTIREIIVPELLANNDINPKSDNLKKLDIFNNRTFSFIVGKGDNAAMLAIYFNTYLKRELGKPRSLWEESDYELAWKQLKKLEKFIDKKLSLLNDWTQ